MESDRIDLDKTRILTSKKTTNVQMIEEEEEEEEEAIFVECL